MASSLPVVRCLFTPLNVWLVGWTQLYQFIHGLIQTYLIDVSYRLFDEIPLLNCESFALGCSLCSLSAWDKISKFTVGWLPRQAPLNSRETARALRQSTNSTNNIQNNFVIFVLIFYQTFSESQHVDACLLYTMQVCVSGIVPVWIGKSRRSARAELSKAIIA